MAQSIKIKDSDYTRIKAEKKLSGVSIQHIVTLALNALLGNKKGK